MRDRPVALRPARRVEAGCSAVARGARSPRRSAGSRHPPRPAAARARTARCRRWRPRTRDGSPHRRDRAAQPAAGRRHRVRVSRARSMRSTSRSFHSAVIASGAGAPERAVITTKHRPAVTTWLTTSAEASSSSWTSSITTSVRSPSPPNEWTASCSRSPRNCAPASMRGSSGASAPSGMADEARVARTRAQRNPRRWPMRKHSSARRDFPTPAGPASSTPAASGRSSARSSCSSSLARPTRGHSPGGVTVTTSPTICQRLSTSPRNRAKAPARSVGLSGCG